MLNRRKKSDQIDIRIYDSEFLPEAVTGRFKGTDSLSCKLGNIF